MKFCPVFRTVWQVLHEPHHVIAQVADSTTKESRKFFRLPGSKPVHYIPEIFKGIIHLKALALATPFLAEYGVSSCTEFHKGLHAYKTVPPPSLSAFNALKQEGIALVIKLGKEGYRGVHVHGNLFPYRDYVVRV